MDDTIEALLEGVKDFPRDNARKLIVADAIEENGDPATADAFRWAAKHNRHPKREGNSWRWLPKRLGTKTEKRYHVYRLLFQIEGAEAENTENGWCGMDGPYGNLFSAFAGLGEALAVIRKEVM